MADRAQELPKDAVMVHIGPHKTGTSSIQSVADVSRDALRANGVVYPGTAVAHHVAARSLRQLTGGWADDVEAAPDPKWWVRLAAKAAAEPGRVLISSEFFAQADADQRRRLVDDLGPDRVQIVMAARNPGDIAVSTWQQVLRQGYPVTLERWLEKNFRRTERAARPEGFWSFADSATLAQQWAEVIAPERITVIVLDERDRRLLANTFEQLLGLPDDLLADVTPPDQNRGLSAAEAALLLQVIKATRSTLGWPDYSRIIRSGMVMRLLRNRQPRADEPKSVLPGWAVEQAAVEGQRIITDLGGSGVRIVGDLANLAVARAPSEGVDTVDEVPLDLATEAVVGAVAAAMNLRWDLTPRSPRSPGTDADAAGRGRDVDAVPTRELAGLVGRRAATAAKRRIRRQFGGD